MNAQTLNMAVDLAGIRLRNPVMTASGTFGYGEEFADYVDLHKIGAYITKGLSPRPRLAHGSAFAFKNLFKTLQRCKDRSNLNGPKMPSALYAPGHHAMNRGACQSAFSLLAALSRPRPCMARFTTSRGYHPCAIHKWLCLF